MLVSLFGKTRKAQIITLEHVFFFAIGAIMLSVVMVVFTSIQGKITDYAVIEDFKNIGNYVAKMILEAYVLGQSLSNSDQSLVEFPLDLPKQIGDHSYVISLEEELNIYSIKNAKLSYSCSFYNIDRTIDISGKIQSTDSGTVVIRYYKEAGEIRLEVV